VALFFVLIKRTKNQVSREASLPHMACAAKRLELGTRFYAIASPHFTYAPGKTFHCPAAALAAHCSNRFRTKFPPLTGKVEGNESRSVLAFS